ncbi:MAG TPA: polysaccharide biosynthesis/export family protein [Tepidisphaeraceae bacterium]|nr:polysaccharide biosynthesis/export family protein [Tepidisphaeraceae bacterium]
MRNGFTVIVIAVVAVLGTRAGAAEPPGAPAAPGPKTTIAESVGTIEPRDLLRLTIGEGGVVELSRRVRVDADGMARVPFLPPVKLAGRTTADAERALATALREAQVMRAAVVRAWRVEAGSRLADEGGPIARGDVLSVTIGELLGAGTETELRPRVGSDGVATLPYVGAVKVFGLTEAKAEAAVAKALADAGVIRTPQVTLWRVAGGGAAAAPLAPGDVYDVNVAGLKKVGVAHVKRVRVGAGGEIGVPYVGPVKIGGLEEGPASLAIAKALRDNRIIEQPVVWLTPVSPPGGGPAPAAPAPIAKGDVLRVTVGDLAGPGEETVAYLTVDAAAGAVRPPLVTDAVPVAGLTEVAAEAAIAKAYRDARVVQNPLIGVFRLDPAAPFDEADVRAERK